MHAVAGPAVIAVVGATATGKTALSLDLAERLGGEIVNADSMQFYRGMDLGTAKLPLGERRGIPHHQIDTLDVTEDASVARYQVEARADIAAIHARGARAIVVGGSGLYLRALLDHFDFPATDASVRAELEARALHEGPGVLFRELSAVDPAAASAIPPQNTKRVIRALEVIALTGAPYSSSLPRREYALPAVQVGLRLPYDVLDARVDARAGSMWDAGLAHETRSLVAQGLRDGTTARRAVGYAEALAYLDGALSEAEARDATARNSRRLARRQMKWFSPDERVTWVSGAAGPEDGNRVLRDVLSVVATLDP